MVNNMRYINIALALLSAVYAEASEFTVAGPDGKLEVTVGSDAATGSPYYSIIYDNDTVLEKSPLGFRANIGDFSRAMTLTAEKVDDRRITYINPHIKKSEVDVSYKRLLTSWENGSGQKLDIEFMVSDNDVAFRYMVPREKDTGSIRILSEATGYDFPDGTVTFLTPQSDPMIGWKRTKPSYEEKYRAAAPMTDRSEYGHGYTFPGLFKTPTGKWALLSETGVDSRYCASRLSDYADGKYTVAFPMPGENNGNGSVEPAFSLPGATPWRTITVGESLAPIAETTVVWDVVEPRYEGTKDYTGGRGTWSWILWQDGSINIEDQKKFIDLAAEMGYDFTLVDNWWDTNIGRKGMEELAAYARDRGVELIVWYSSSGYWNDIVQGPTNRMDSPIARKEEMKWLRDIGAAGIKVDFFGGDKQETMRLYEQILSDADDYGLMVIFHGCTLPRGWERMYPNYVGSEAVLASENMIFSQGACDDESFNATLHPFIRNAVGCMEFGGVFLNRHMNRDNDGGNIRRTSDVFQLATGVLFQNPVQNFALAPNNLIDAPSICIDFMKEIPTMWDDVRYIDGYPGRYAVIARRSGNKWYVAGINATDKEIALDLDLGFLAGNKGEYIYDTAKSPATRQITVDKKGRLKVTVQPECGFVIVSESTSALKTSAYTSKKNPIAD